MGDLDRSILVRYGEDLYVQIRGILNSVRNIHPFLQMYVHGISGSERRVVCIAAELRAQEVSFRIELLGEDAIDVLVASEIQSDDYLILFGLGRDFSFDIRGDVVDAARSADEQRQESEDAQHLVLFAKPQEHHEIRDGHRDDAGDKREPADLIDRHKNRAVRVDEFRIEREKHEHEDDHDDDADHVQDDDRNNVFFLLRNADFLVCFLDSIINRVFH